MSEKIIKRIEDMMHESSNREYDNANIEDYERGYRKALREVLKMIEEEEK